MNYLFIPSCEVAAVDSLAGTTTLKRLRKGLAIFKQGKFDKIIVSGGIYLPPTLQKKPSGILMRDWLIKQGIKSDEIITEKKSRDTYENIHFALQLTKDDPNRRFTVITHWQHAMRFWVTFRRGYGIKAKVIPMWYWYNLETLIFEWPILIIHLLDKRGTSKISRKNRANRTY